MLAAARRGDWDAVSRSEVTRRGLINQAFGGDADPVRVAGLADFLEEILRLDRELIAHAEAARRQCAAQLGALRKSKKALKAYQSPAVTP